MNFNAVNITIHMYSLNLRQTNQKKCFPSQDQEVYFNKNAEHSRAKSVDMIYECAVPPKLGSNSSEEDIRFNSSNEIDKKINSIISECRERT